jgi:hypothetical protein
VPTPSSFFTYPHRERFFFLSCFLLIVGVKLWLGAGGAGPCEAGSHGQMKPLKTEELCSQTTLLHLCTWEAWLEPLLGSGWVRYGLLEPCGWVGWDKAKYRGVDAARMGDSKAWLQFGEAGRAGARTWPQAESREGGKQGEQWDCVWGTVMA